MVRSRVVAALLVSALTMLLALAAPASATFTGTSGGGSGSGQPPSDPGSQGSSGDPVHKPAGGCSLYANSSSYGVACFTGGNGKRAQTVGDILAGDAPPECWDEVIPDDQLRPMYAIVPNPDSAYYVNYCITGLNVDNSPFYQPGVQLNPTVIEIPRNSPDCPLVRKGKDKGKIDLAPGQNEYNCVEVLTTNQTTVVHDLESDSDAGRIPEVGIVMHPSRVVRTNQDIVYVVPVSIRNEISKATTDKYRAGAVTMWATMDQFAIYPYGPDGGVRKVCNGLAALTDQDTPQTTPDACWWKYPKSSADQPRRKYPFRAEADWTVHYRVTLPGGRPGPDKTLATFHKYLDKPLTVFDVQSIVVH